ncbi:MAG: DUF4760 domain-containing protein [Microcoleaceae cyanobacterium MO_207.B10]|nr:DUF4760 domain-containing protein [Microcoleaceae cyanobacterium MO_207.B10]
MTTGNHKDHNHLGQVILVLSFLFSGVLTLTYVWIDKNHPEYKGTLQFIVPTFTTGAITLSAYSAYRSLRQAQKDKKLDKAYRLIERWNSPEMLLLEFAAKQILNDLRNNQQSMQMYIEQAEKNNNQEKIHKLIKILNFLVEISICIENRVADEKVLKSFFQGIVEDYCEIFYDLIHFRREGKGNPERYKKLIELRSKWNGSAEKT